MPQTPTPVTVGRLVLYKLTKEDVEAINRRRTAPNSIAERLENETWPIGAQAHIGNEVAEGDLLPTLVVKVWEGNSINAQVFLDGNDTLWVTSVQQGGETGQWDWMPFQKDQQARLAKEPVEEKKA